MSRIKRSQLRVGFLVAVYIMRMIFFQSLVASPSVKQISSLRNIVKQHESKRHTHVPVTHRLHVQKEIAESIKINPALTLESFLFSAIITKVSPKHITLGFYQASCTNQLPANNKRYVEHCTYLI